MITINLLAGGRATQLGRGRLVAAACIAAGWLGLAAYGAHLFEARRDLAAKVEEADARLAQVTSAATRLDTLRKRHRELSDEVAAIRHVLETRRSAADLFQAVGRSVPRGLSLVEMKRSAAAITVDGRAPSLSAISEFVHNLGSDLSLSTPLEVRSMTTEVSGGSSTLRFQIAAEAMPAPADERRR